MKILKIVQKSMFTILKKVPDIFFNNDVFDRHNVHLRMLAILGSDINKGESPLMALTEVFFNFVVALLMFLLFLFSFVVFLSSIFPNPDMRHILF